MEKYSVFDCSIVELDKHHSDRKGNLSVVENGVTLPFDVKRVYYLYDVPGGESRGAHAHKELSQLIVAASGSFNVVLDDGKCKRTFFLNRPNMGLYVKPGMWRDLCDFSSGAVCMVLASHPYDENDYIRDYNEFVKYNKNSREMIKEGRTIYFRLVEIDDADFIHSLRVDTTYNKYLSVVDDVVEKQREWIKAYKQRESNKQEYYFIIHRKDNGTPIGTLRIYDFIPEENSFCWGSWILNENKTRYAALECAMCVYEFAFEELGYKRCHMDMRKENKGVIEFHKRFGIQIYDESEIDYFAYLYKEDYLNVKEQFNSFLDSHIQ